MYKVILEDPAISDLHDIHNYMSQTLKAPVAAQRIYTSIKTEIKTLNQNPMRCKVVDEEPFRTLGIRPLYVENYTAFFIINEDAKKVHILRILYNRREWQNLLHHHQLPLVTN